MYNSIYVTKFHAPVLPLYYIYFVDKFVYSMVYGQLFNFIVTLRFLVIIWQFRFYSCVPLCWQLTAGSVVYINKRANTLAQQSQWERFVGSLWEEKRNSVIELKLHTVHESSILLSFSNYFVLRLCSMYRVLSNEA